MLVSPSRLSSGIDMSARGRRCFDIGRTYITSIETASMTTTSILLNGKPGETSYPKHRYASFGVEGEIDNRGNS